MNHIETPEELFDRRLPRHDLVTVAEVADAGNISRSVVSEWIESGQVPAVNLASRPDGNARWNMNRDAVIEFIRKRREGACT